MRLAFVLIAGAAAALAAPAAAQTVQPISFSPAFQETVHTELGDAEGEYLRDLVNLAVTAELQQRGLADGAGQIDISIIDAQPNRMTLLQRRNQPHVDIANSTLRGGAELQAVIHGTDGQVSEVNHSYYTPRIDEISPRDTWTDARQSIRRFAEKVADAYANTH